ncbi:hypothetical protein [Microbaculum marinum]|uniref:Adenylate cyclase n=1 Tax=Microbaculum marinum TaxID=1764581 RepID=A0AAW9RXR6_9HYPH
MARRPPEVVQPADDTPRVVIVAQSAQALSGVGAAAGRWERLVSHVVEFVLPAHSGRLVESGKGRLVLEFGAVRPALAAAFAIQAAAAGDGGDGASGGPLQLSLGIEFDDAIAEGNGHRARGIEVASGLTSLAGPGEIVVSAEARSQLTQSLDAEVEDLGECPVDRIEEPIRAYRVGPPTAVASDLLTPPEADVRPTLAIVPFADRTNLSAHHFFGEIFAEELIRTMSHSHELNVISRLSTTALRGRDLSLAQISTHLRSNYVLSGTYRVLDLYFGLDLELAETRSGQVIWSDQLEGRVDEVVSGQRELVHRVIAGISEAIQSREVRQAQLQTLPTMQSYTMLLGAVGLMHRLSARDFEQARRLLEAVHERAPGRSEPLAWLGKWYVLRVQQGWTDDPKQDAQHALRCTTRALDSDPNSALALTIDGIVNTNLLKRLDLAQDRYEHAIEINRSEALGWLLKGTLHAFRGEGPQAVLDTQRAGMLSPLDPHRYFYDSLAATAYLSNYQYDLALEHANRSLRANRTHTSTLRAAAVAQWRLGRREEAGATIRELLTLEPTLTVRGWLRRSPSADYPIGQEWAAIFREIGIPD